MKRRTVEILSSAASIVGESPVWLPTRRELAMVDVHGQRVRRIDWATHAARDFVLEERPGSVVGEPDGSLLVFAGKSVCRLAPDGTRATLASDLPLAGERFNDVRRGPDGRIWGGTFSRGREAAFYRFSSDWRPSELLGGVGNSNGIVWDEARRFLYHVDTPCGTVTRYRYEEGAGVLSERRVIRTFAPREGLPDGMCADADGRLWVALWGAGRVACLDPADGREVDAIELPVSQPACPAFAGDDLSTLVVTTAAHGRNLREEPLAGATFAVER